MKTSYILPVALLSLSLAACGGGNGGNNAQTVAQDKAQEQSAQPEQAQPDKQPFLTQDLRMYNFYGKVKNFKVMVSEADAKMNPQGTPMDNVYLDLEYDADGHFVNAVSESATKKDIVAMDGDKIIKTETAIEDFAGCKISSEYTYDETGLLKLAVCAGMECNSTCQYTYNADGELVKLIEKSAGEGMVNETEMTFTILERDAHKNWTKRFVEINDKEGVDDGSGKLEPQATKYELQTRTINYWD